MAQAVDGALRAVSRTLRQGVASYCDIETTDDDYTLVSRDGGLVSVLRVQGIARMVGGKDFDSLCRQMEIMLNPPLAEQGHRLDFIFHVDPEQGGSEVARALRPARKTTSRLSLELGDILDARKDALAGLCHEEVSYVVVWTRPQMLPKVDRTHAGTARGKAIGKAPSGRNTQVMDSALPSLRDPHQSLVSGIVSEFNDHMHILTEKVEVHVALREIRRMLFPEVTHDEWMPRLPGDPLPLRAPERVTSPHDYEYLLYPRIEDQLFPSDAEVVNPRTIRIGERFHTPVVMSMGPQQPAPFQTLFMRLRERKIPWRCCFTIEGDGIAALSTKSMLASLLHFTSRENRRLNAAIDILRKEDEAGNESVRFSANFDTWSSDAQVSRSHASFISRAIQNWGGCNTMDLSGDPLLGVISTIPALSVSSPAPVMAAPTGDVVQMLPFLRPVSLWDEGSLLLRSPDGRVMPYQMGSGLQSAAVALVVGRMGSGKSVFLNALTLSSVTAPGQMRLPLSLTIDIAPSSKGAILLIQDALPVSRRHEAAYFRWRMSTDNAVNPFDTALGSHQPIKTHEALLKNLLTLLLTPVGQESPYEGIPGLVSRLIESVYDNLSPGKNPKLYDDGVCPFVDDAIQKHNLYRDSHTTWWEIVDALFAEGDHRAAIAAQRYAVPLLGDCASLVRMEEFTRVYENTTPGRETLPNYVWRTLVESEQSFPILSAPTQFDIDNARIVSIDLEDVAPKGNPAANRQTAIMYLLARHVGAKEILLHKEDLPDFNPKYLAYHQQRLEALRGVPRCMAYDEYHRTSSAAAVREQVMLDIREGRKRGYRVVLASQRHVDFDETLVSLATSIFILGGETDENNKQIVEKFGFPQYAEYLLKHKITGPGRGGSNMLAYHTTKRGPMYQYQTITLPSVELWAYSTTEEDTAIRDALYVLLGPADARARLAERFPSGSAKNEIERRRVLLDAGAANDVIPDLIKEVATAAT